MILHESDTKRLTRADCRGDPHPTELKLGLGILRQIRFAFRQFAKGTICLLPQPENGTAFVNVIKFFSEIRRLGLSCRSADYLYGIQA